MDIINKIRQKTLQGILLTLPLGGVVGTLLSSCSDDTEDRAVAVPASDSGTWTDPRDGETYNWVRYGSTDWMTQNFRYNLNSEDQCSIYQPSDDYSYGTNTDNLAKYGRLYTESGALNACPDGWRLPTDDDWQKLEITLGMSPTEAAARDWRGNIAHNMLTIKGDTCQLNLLLGGFYDTYIGMGASKWRMMGAFGFYWTSTKDTEKEGEYYYYRKFAYNRNDVYRESMEPSANMLSVRYIRDAQ